MTQSVNDAPLAVDGDVIRRPVWHSWMLLGFGVYCTAVGLGVLAFVIFIWSRNGHAQPPRVLITFCVGTGIFSLAGGAFLFRFGLWYLIGRPRWVIGADQLQFIDGPARVRLAIPYANLAAAELSKPGMGVAPFIGLRLVYPELIKFYAGSMPVNARRRLARFGFHWWIAGNESEAPLPIVLEKIQRRFQQWKATASGSPASAPAPNPVTDVTAAPAPQENFTPKNP
jgi:hypothetical protein